MVTSAIGLMKMVAAPRSNSLIFASINHYSRRTTVRPVRNSQIQRKRRKRQKHQKHHWHQHQQNSLSPPSKNRKFCATVSTGAQTIPAPKYLVKNLLPETGIGLLSGQWGTYKTFIAIKLGACVGTAQPFAGYAVKRPGAVLYLACEGAGELPVRLEALSTVEHGGSVLPIYYCDAGIRLLDPTSVASIIATAKQVNTDAQRDNKLPLALVIIDTVISAAAFAKSGDENDSAVGAKVMAALGIIFERNRDVHARRKITSAKRLKLERVARPRRKMPPTWCSRSWLPRAYPAKWQTRNSASVSDAAAPRASSTRSRGRWSP